MTHETTIQQSDDWERLTVLCTCGWHATVDDITDAVIAIDDHDNERKVQAA